MRGTAAGLWLIALISVALPETPPTAPPPEKSDVWRLFWRGVDELNLVFKAVGNLSDGVDQGEIWVVDLPTGQRHRIYAAGGLAWPVMAPDGTTVFALRGRQLVRLQLSGGEEVAVGGTAN